MFGKAMIQKFDLGEIVRDVDELMVINDEAHHIHDPKMAWFKSIEDIHNQLLQKRQKVGLCRLMLRLRQKIIAEKFLCKPFRLSLVEAIHQGVVKIRFTRIRQPSETARKTKLNIFRKIRGLYQIRS